MKEPTTQVTKFLTKDEFEAYTKDAKHIHKEDTTTLQYLSKYRCETLYVVNDTGTTNK